MRRCCNVEQIIIINGFNLPVDFMFGVTGPSQGNTHSASLLGYHVSLSQYLISKSRSPISIESCSDVANCSEPGKCCDVTYISTDINLTTNFTFGVTRPSQ